jgi:hypothetical protein
MTLPYRQERLLRRTDRALCESDPDLAAMLSIFARITAADGLPAWEQLRPGLTWIWGVLLWPVAAAAFIVVFVAGGAAVRSRALRWSVKPPRRADRVSRGASGWADWV